MFTGIIEEIGCVIGVITQNESIEFTIKAEKILAGLRLGDSIAVNGVCLTVTKFNQNSFRFCVFMLNT